MRIAVIQFPGSNCEAESLRAVRQAGMEAEEFLWNRNYDDLKNFDGYFIVGGFSYEDRSRSGVIASLDPMMRSLRREAETGKPLLGICNGAQILVETGLVPGLKNNRAGMALAVNKRMSGGKILGTGFYNSWVNIRLSAPSLTCAFTRHLHPGEFIRLPVAHAEGRFVIPDELLKEMQDKNLTVFRYSDGRGNMDPEFPINPNGAIFNLAAVCNRAGNVMAMMPHPERTADGQPIFTSMREYIMSKKKIIMETLDYEPETAEVKEYASEANSAELLVNLIITDNEAVTVKNSLQNLGIKTDIKRYTHWEIIFEEGADSANLLAEIVKSGELFNSNKEKLIARKDEPGKARFLIRYNDDFVGQNKTDILKNRFGLKGIKAIKKGVLWEIGAQEGDLEDVKKRILDSRILYNQFSEACFRFTPLEKAADSVGGCRNNSLDEGLMPPSKYSRSTRSLTGFNHADYGENIKRNLNNCLTKTDLGAGRKKIGKVRDIYELADKMILISTDRQSAFDRILASIPFKGQVLNQISAWWFEKTKHIAPNHILAVPDPNVTIGKKCTVFPVEFVVRGYITGTTDTSAWMNYQKGVRFFCGHRLPEGLKKNQKFDQPIITPTTKSDEHDRPISGEEIAAEGLMSREDWNYVSAKALEIFSFGQKIAAEHGLILVDTKYEFGKDREGNILLIDELHTPDSSRYWLKDTYEEKISRGEEPDNIDKEFLRLWFKEHCDPYHDQELPPAPDDLVIELSRRYIKLYEMITNEKFIFPNDADIKARIANNFKKIIFNNMMAVIIMGSESDAEFAKKIIERLDADQIAHAEYVASAHKQPAKVLEILEQYRDEKAVYITIAGRSNALSGFVAANSKAIVLACPPFADKLDMMVNIHSTLQMPSQVPVLTVLDPGNCALAVKRIFDFLS